MRGGEFEVLSKDDARAIVRLLGEVAVSEESLPAKRQRLMDGLCGLIDADCWTWALGINLRPDSLPAWVLQLHGGFDDERLMKFVRAQEHPDLTALTAPFAALMMERKAHISRLRQQTDPEDRFRSSGAYPLWKEVDVAPGIMSCRPVDATTLSAVSIHRRMDEPLFTARDLRIAHIVLTEVPWLHPKANAGRDSAGVPALSPRRRTVFMLLVQGYSRGRIASNLELSRHTVDEYVKEIYRHFDVHSQAELIGRFTKGDGGDA
jgi:DNA-binding CsgD family transcriptional regulator